MIKEWLASQARYQLSSMKQVKPEHRCDGATIYLNSEAGWLRFKPRTIPELAEFRDRYVNQFDQLAQRRQRGEDVGKEFFQLYRRIEKDWSHRLKAKANLHTRIRAIFTLAFLTMLAGCVTEGRITHMEMHIYRLQHQIDVLETKELCRIHPGECLLDDRD